MSQALRDADGFYHINGKKHQSITSIIKEQCPHMALDAWKERTPNWTEVGRKAAMYGTLMHLQLQGTIADIPLDIPHEFSYKDWAEDPELLPELQGRMEQWLALELELGRPNLMEHTVVVERHDEEGDVQSAGTWDYLGPVDKMVTMLDWKSSKRPQKSHRIQLGAYYLGAKAEGRKVDWGIIAYIRKNSAELVEMPPEEMQEAGEKFLEIARKAYLKANPK